MVVNTINYSFGKICWRSGSFFPEYCNICNAVDSKQFLANHAISCRFFSIIERSASWSISTFQLQYFNFQQQLYLVFYLRKLYITVTYLKRIPESYFNRILIFQIRYHLNFESEHVIVYFLKIFIFKNYEVCGLRIFTTLLYVAYYST